MKKLKVHRTEYIWHFLGFDSSNDAVHLAEWFVEVLINEGELKVNVDDNFKQRTHIPFFMVNVEDDELEEFLLDEFDENDIPIEFEFKGENYQLELEKG